MVSPDGNAHSQSESIGTMLQYLHGTNLHVPIMAPILSSDDVVKMINEPPKKNSKKRKSYANRLSTEHPGYLYLA